jgi:hypothetical protein
MARSDLPVGPVFHIFFIAHHFNKLIQNWHLGGHDELTPSFHLIGAHLFPCSLVFVHNEWARNSNKSCTKCQEKRENLILYISSEQVFKPHSKEDCDAKLLFESLQSKQYSFASNFAIFILSHNIWNCWWTNCSEQIATVFDKLPPRSYNMFKIYLDICRWITYNYKFHTNLLTAFIDSSIWI